MLDCILWTYNQINLIMSNHHLFSLSAFLLCALLAISCEKDNPAENAEQYSPGNIGLSSEQQAMVVANNDFAFNLFRHAVDGQDKSVFISPVSVTYALSMLTNGASNDTYRELMNGLGFGKYAIGDVNKLCNKLMTGTPKLDDKTTIDIANALVVRDGSEIKQAFKSELQNNYSALVESKDFASPATLSFINDWAKGKTHGMIPNLLEEINPDAASYLMNAIYFKGKWFAKFDKSQTNKETFTTENDQRLDAMMMHQRAYFHYNQNSTYSTVILSYGNGSFEMAVLLPMEGKTVADVLADIDAAKWKNNRDGCRSVNVDLKLPKFTTSTFVLFNKPLADMGMSSMLDPKRASFDLFSDSKVFVSKVFQKAKIEVEEEGTKAAAVTVVEMTFTSALPEKDYTDFHANRPFVYAITEHSSGAIMFMGVYKGE